jgi:hypothetical protein
MTEEVGEVEEIESLCDTIVVEVTWSGDGHELMVLFLVQAKLKVVRHDGQVRSEIDLIWGVGPSRSFDDGRFYTVLIRRLRDSQAAYSGALSTHRSPGERGRRTPTIQVIKATPLCYSVPGSYNVIQSSRRADSTSDNSSSLTSLRSLIGHRYSWADSCLVGRGSTG